MTAKETLEFYTGIVTAMRRQREMTKGSAVRICKVVNDRVQLYKGIEVLAMMAGQEVREYEVVQGNGKKARKAVFSHKGVQFFQLK